MPDIADSSFVVGIYKMPSRGGLDADACSMPPKGSRRARKHHRTLEAIRGHAGDTEGEIVDRHIGERHAVAAAGIARMRPSGLRRVAPMHPVSRRGNPRRGIP